MPTLINCKHSQIQRVGRPGYFSLREGMTKTLQFNLNYFKICYHLCFNHKYYKSHKNYN